MPKSSKPSVTNPASPSSSSAKLKGKAIGVGIVPVDPDEEDMETYGTARRDGEITLSLLQTLHPPTTFQVSPLLESFLPTPDDTPVITYHMATFELGPMGGMDARYLEWLAGEYRGGASVVIKRGWKEMLGAIFGYG